MGRIKEVDRKRTQHQKVRTGCDKCKARRIKCPEGNPCRRCVIAKLDCSYSQVPQAKIFTLEDGIESLGFYEVGYETSDSTRESDQRRESSSASDSDHSSTDHDHINQFYSTPASSGLMPNNEAILLQEFCLRRGSDGGAILKSPSSTPYRGTLETSARDFSLHWLTHYTTPRSVLPLQLWLQRIHQHAYHFAPLRNLVISMGSIGLSIAQGHDESTHNAVLRRAHKYTHSAIVSLDSSTTKVPTIIMLYCAWIFWQLDLITGNLASSYLHVQSAFRIAKEAAETPGEEVVDEEELGGLFGSTGPTFLIDTSVCPEAFSPLNSPLKRKRHALAMIKGTIRDISEKILDTSTDQSVPPDARIEIVRILDGCRKDSEWLLRKWAEDVAGADASMAKTALWDSGNNYHRQRPQDRHQTKQRRPMRLEELSVDSFDTTQQVLHLPPLAFGAVHVTHNAAKNNMTLSLPPLAPIDQSQKDPSIIDMYDKALAIAAADGYTAEAVAQFKMYALQFVLQISQLVGQADLGMRTDLLVMLERQRAWQGVG